MHGYGVWEYEEVPRSREIWDEAKVMKRFQLGCNQEFPV